MVLSHGGPFVFRKRHGEAASLDCCAAEELLRAEFLEHRSLFGAFDDLVATWRGQAGEREELSRLFLTYFFGGFGSLYMLFFSFCVLFGSVCVCVCVCFVVYFFWCLSWIVGECFFWFCFV